LGWGDNILCEDYKSIAYTQKDIQKLEKQYMTKILRVFRNHEKRIARIEKQLGITPSPYELMEKDIATTD